MSAVKKAVIPAAGLGTRMLPITHAVPKEMLPIVDCPAVYYLVKEAVDSGITDILIITGRDKEAMENFFDHSPEYDAALTAKGRTEWVDRLHEIAGMANIHFIRQKEARGLGHAIGCARAFVGSDPFAVLYGDDVIFSRRPVCAQMIETYEKYGRPVVGLKHVPLCDIGKYCSMKAEAIPGSDTEYLVTDMVEKPKPEQVMSDMAILGRVLLEPDIFDRIDHLKPGAGGEIQLTDAMCQAAREHGVTGLVFEGERFDLGSKLGWLMANVKQGVLHSEVGEDFRRFLLDFAETLR